MTRVLDICCLLVVGALAIYDIVRSELASSDGRFAEGAFYFLHGLVFLGLFVGFRVAMRRRDR